MAHPAYGQSSEGSQPSSPKQSASKASKRCLSDGYHRRTEKCKNQYVAPAIALAIETGMRRSEILNLTWNNVDLKEGVAFLPLTKNGKPRTVPLSPPAISILKGVNKLDDTDNVLPISSSALRLAWERLRRRSKVKDLRFHDLQHEAISRFFEIGLSMPEVALVSGHQDARMLLRYTHVNAKAVASKLKGLSKG